MTSDEKQSHSARLSLHVKNLVVSSQRKAELEKAAQEMAERADSLGCLNPLADEPSLVFDPGN